MSTEEPNTSFDPLQATLDKAAQALDGCGPTTEDINPEILSNVLHSISYFHKNLQPPANVYDFVQYAKNHLGYEVHAPGTILMRSGEVANKLSIIIKGTVQKIQVRTYEDIDREFKIKHPYQVRKDDTQNPIEEEEEDSAQKKAVPRYLQHTMATMKKANTFRLGAYAATSKLDAEIRAAESGKLTLSRSLTGLDTQSFKFQTRLNQSGTSLNDLDSHNQSQDSKPVKKEGGKPEFRRMQTMGAATGGKGLSDSFLGLKEEGSKTTRSRRLKEEDNNRVNDFSILHEEDTEFLELLANVAPKYPEIKFFLCDVARFKKVRTYVPGDCIGENFFREYRKKETGITLTTTEEVHMLTLSRENYRSILTTMFENAKEKVEFFIQLLPSFEEERVRKFSYNFCEREFKKNEQIYNEDDESGDLFVLRSGNVKLFKEPISEMHVPSISNFVTTSPRNFQKKELPIASIIENQFFGEEILLNEERRFCSARAAVNGTMAYFMEARVYNLIKSNFKELLKTLKQQTRERFEWRQQRAVDLMEQKKQQQQQNVKPTVAAPEFVAKTVKSNSAAFCMTAKSAKAGESMKLIQFQSEADERKAQELQQLRSMVLKTNKVLVVGSRSMVKNLALYKEKFSRKAKNTEKNKVEEKYQQIRANEAAKAQKAAEDLAENDLVTFNLRKEFQEKKIIKLRLPSLNLGGPNRGSETTRHISTKEPESAVEASMAVPNTSRKGTKSTILDYFGVEENETGLFRQRSKTKPIISPINVQSAVLVSEKSYVTPRNFLAEEREDILESLGSLSARNLKKGPAIVIKKKPKLVERKEEFNFAGVVGKKPEFYLKQMHAKGI